MNASVGSAAHGRGPRVAAAPQPIEADENFGSTRYAADEHDALPAEAVAASLGCGNPTAVAEPRSGERALGLGSGRRIGPHGRAYGLDMTGEMLGTHSAIVRATDSPVRPRQPGLTGPRTAPTNPPARARRHLTPNHVPLRIISSAATSHLATQVIQMPRADRTPSLSPRDWIQTPSFSTRMRPHLQERAAMTTSSDTPVLDTLAAMTLDSVERCGLPADTLILTRIAALAAMDAPPVSYLAHIDPAIETNLTAEQVQDVLVAVAPIVGTAKVMAAAANIAKALGFAIAVTEAESTK
ncbi:hypothetical protein ABZ656_14550 [Streptomyces sp. NPDC007095]|uniref:carboxymuconolactone decarboxylase family protein n=1 Tax=Streptomyces sp. NPDC007095 TaxID=3154482 RepID=UPI0033F4EC69